MKFIIDEGVDAFVAQSLIQMAGKTFAGIFASKAQEDVKVPSASGRRRRRRRGGSFTVQESH